MRAKKHTGPVPVKPSSEFLVSRFRVAKTQWKTAGTCEASRSLILCPLSFVLCPRNLKTRNPKPETRNQKLINSETAQSPRFLGAYESPEIFFNFPLALRAGI